MTEHIDFPAELLAAAKGLDDTMPYTRDLLMRAANEIKLLNTRIDNIKATRSAALTSGNRADD